MASNNLDAASGASSRAASRWPLIIAATVSTLGGLLFGYDNIVISGAIGYLSQLFQLDAAGIGWAAACALVGCIVGCAAAGTVADYLGKKKGLGLCALCFAISSIGILFAANLHQFVLWRLIGGVGIGAASVIAPNYIAEIAPTRVRGRCVTLYQLGIVVGILAAVFVNMLIQRMGDEAWNISTGWRWMFFAGVVPAILFGVMILPAVESPRWLMKMGQREKALSGLSSAQWPGTRHQRSRRHRKFLGHRRRPHLRTLHHLPPTTAARYHARRPAATQRHHARFFLPPRNFSRRRHCPQRRLLPIRPGQPDQPGLHSIRLVAGR